MLERTCVRCHQRRAVGSQVDDDHAAIRFLVAEARRFGQQGQRVKSRETQERRSKARNRWDFDQTMETLNVCLSSFFRLTPTLLSKRANFNGPPTDVWPIACASPGFRAGQMNGLYPDHLELTRRAFEPRMQSGGDERSPIDPSLPLVSLPWRCVCRNARQSQAT